jgi:RNA polymerase sigma-70 factor (ECF subfamily)
MQPDSSFADLMERVRRGDQDAARRIVDTFFRRLIGLARLRLEGPILTKEGPEDVVQSALASFFRRQASDPFELASWDSLWGLLSVITLRKCGHHVEYYLAQCRDIRREIGAADTMADDSTAPWQAIAREPRPEEAVALRDTLGHLLEDMDQRERNIVQQTLEGYSVPQISRKVGRSEYLVRKVLDRVKERWRRMCR